LRYPNDKSQGTAEADMAEYKPGSMDISEHEKTFDGFIKMSTRVAIASILIIIFVGLVNG
jgi:hypothetical protein